MCVPNLLFQVIVLATRCVAISKVGLGKNSNVNKGFAKVIAHVIDFVSVVVTHLGCDTTQNYDDSDGSNMWRKHSRSGTRLKSQPSS